MRSRGNCVKKEGNQAKGGVELRVKRGGKEKQTIQRKRRGKRGRHGQSFPGGGTQGGLGGKRRGGRCKGHRKRQKYQKGGGRDKPNHQIRNPLRTKATGVLFAPEKKEREP